MKHAFTQRRRFRHPHHDERWEPLTLEPPKGAVLTFP